MNLVKDDEIKSFIDLGYFDEDWYLRNYPDVKELGMDAAEHFFSIGFDIGRQPSPAITNDQCRDILSNWRGDKAYPHTNDEHVTANVPAPVLSNNSAPVLLNSKESARIASLILETKLFDAKWYSEKYQLPSNEDPLTHFVSTGMQQGFDPSDSFSSAKYLAQYEDVASAGSIAFHHYLFSGRSEYRSIFTHQAPSGYDSIESALPDTFFLRQRERKHDIAVVVHVFYPQLWQEISQYLDNIEEGFDIYVSLVQDKSDHIKEIIINKYPDAKILIFPNHGRDVFPLSEFLNAGVLDGYDLVCKIHTKRSLHRDDGDAWRRQLYDGLLGSSELVRNICKHMRCDPDVGMVVPDGFLYNAEYMGSNADALLALLDRIGLEANLEKIVFPAGNMFWASATVIQFLKALKLSFSDYELEMGQLDGTLGHAVERYAGIVCSEAAQKMITTCEITPTPSTIYDGSRHKLIAFYLPQYHPIPENDKWWGKGFTEWRNVEKARPAFEGHRQPRRPADLGYYDLRIDQVREEQANLAKTFGIDAFCYYHYWFDGKKLLDLPLNKLLQSDLDFPFCICWANENWTRSWDGLNKDVLIPQTYDENILNKYPHDVYKYLSDGRYLKFDAKPVFLIYKIFDLPNPKQTVLNWRKTWRELGLGEVHIAAVRTFPDPDKVQLSDLAVDAFVDFPPHGVSAYVTPAAVKTVSGFEGLIYKYKSAMEGDIDRYRRDDSSCVHRGVMGAWDNSARRGMRAHLAHGASPITFRSWLRRSLIQDAENNPKGDRLTFINAWNEWAEGTYLEPDQHYGIAYLEAVRSTRVASKE